MIVVAVLSRKAHEATDTGPGSGAWWGPGRGEGKKGGRKIPTATGAVGSEGGSVVAVGL